MMNFFVENFSNLCYLIDGILGAIWITFVKSQINV